MTECLSLLESLRPHPHPYLTIASVSLISLPVAAGLALVAKRLRKQISPNVVLGVFTGTLWTGWLALDVLFFGTSQKLIPRDLRTPISVLLFLSTMGDWMIQAIRSRFRPFWSDAVVVLLILAVPLAGIAYSNTPKPPQPPRCTDAQLFSE
ncbi:MAG: hypothetical protein BM560_00715 [Roseobacter sp. MedPE-SWde]|nr:MAG: hypothetical protein BM560_00715 [Roseobacter sp. MedPE-SWde]